MTVPCSLGSVQVRFGKSHGANMGHVGEGWPESTKKEEKAVVMWINPLSTGSERSQAARPRSLYAGLKVIQVMIAAPVL